MTDRSLEELRFIAARVIEHVRANPCPPGELLGEMPPPVRVSRPCKRGHDGSERYADGRCAPCAREINLRTYHERRRR